MIKSISILSLSVFVLLCCNACSEFISPNVKDEKLIVNSPKDSLFSSQNRVTFWWENNTKAENYHIQIASPDISNPLNVIDTLTLDKTYIHTFEEGRYEWRIRIENNGSQSAYQKRTFVIDNTPPITPNILSPLDSTYIDANTAFSLEWESLDYPIQDISYPTKDSVYLYRVLGTELYPVSRHFIDFNQSKTWEISSYLNPNKAYVWKVKAFDKSGNGKEGNEYRFYTN